MEKSAPAASTQLVYAVSAWVTLNYLTNNMAANWLVCASIQFMNAITSVSKQTNMMVTKMLTWLKNEFQTSGWHSRLLAQKPSNRKIFPFEMIILLSGWKPQIHRTGPHCGSFSFIFWRSVSKIFLCIHSYVKVLLISHLFTVCSSKKELIGSDGKHSADSFSERVFFSIQNG